MIAYKITYDFFSTVVKKFPDLNRIELLYGSMNKFFY